MGCAFANALCASVGTSSRTRGRAIKRSSALSSGEPYLSHGFGLTPCFVHRPTDLEEREKDMCIGTALYMSGSVLIHTSVQVIYSILISLYISLCLPFALCVMGSIFLSLFMCHCLSFTLYMSLTQSLSVCLCVIDVSL